MIDSAKPMVGRDRERDLVLDHLDQATGGASHFVFVSGEPGIGKTRLLSALVDRGEDRGCLVLQGAGAEFERELPFGLVVDAFDEYLESLDPDRFSRLASQDLAELAGVFPSLAMLDPGSDYPSNAAERFRAHRALGHLIERLASRQPLILVLEDLHWADGASLELMSYLVRRPPDAPVIVAASFRSSQVAQELVATVARAASVRATVLEIELGPLDSADAEGLIESAGAAEFQRLYGASGGNPFYLLQLARMKGAVGGDLSADGVGVDVPAAVAASIHGELDPLSAPARRLAEAAAIVGDPFELDLTKATAGIGEAEALDGLDELTARDLIKPAQVPRRFHFRHPLLRAAVYQSCPPGVRIAAHERCAAALAARDAPAHARAHHVAHAARHGDLAAVAVLREAGEATALRAPLSAARWFEIALGLLPASAEPCDRVSLLMALADAQAATGRFEASRAALLESIALTPDEDGLRVTLIGACAALEQLLGRHDDAHRRLVSALAELPQSSSADAVGLMIRLAAGDFYRMDFDGMRRWGEKAQAAAQRLGEPPLVVASIAVLALAEAFRGAVPEAEACCTEASALVDVLPDDQVGLGLDSLANLATAELYLHRYADAAEHAKRGLSIARATGQGDYSPVLVPILSNVLHMRGDVVESAALLDEAQEVQRLSGNAQALGWHLLSRAFTATAAGDLEIAVDAAEESVEIARDLDDSVLPTHASLALAGALAESGEPRQAISVLLAGAGGAELPLIPAGWRANYFELLTRCWLSVGDEIEAGRAAGRAGAVAETTGLPLAAAMADRAAAAVSLESGDPVMAAERALAAAGAAEKVGARVESARARTLAGRALADAGERQAGIAELENACGQLDAYGAVRYRREAERELRKLGRPVHRRTRPGKASGAGIETLTEREQEVAGLVVDRHTNPEIAARLFLSVKTVETHMRNILRKLDVSSRADVARLVERGRAARS